MSSATSGPPQPTFVCIGAPKCGTTWLYQQLASHPQIWLPPEKEVRYFNKRYPIENSEAPPGRRMGLFGLFRDHPRRVITRALRRSLSPRAGFPIRWMIKFLSGPGDFHWYASLFDPARGRVSGDITPFYASLPAYAVQEIREGFPDLKVIFLMRDPVARAWSNARMMLPLMLERPLAQITEADFADYLARPSAHVEGHYLHALDTWGRAYPQKQFLIEYQDHISTDPQRTLDRITTHLGVEPRAIPAATLAKRVNAGSARSHTQMPPAIRQWLSQYYLTELEQLAERCGRPVTDWLERAQAEAVKR
ncbi:MAG: sulfotransferase [Pseudomonadota bacterium]